MSIEPVAPSKRLTRIASARIPGDGGEIRLFAEGEHFSIKLAGGGDLMSTRMHGSEDALARLACEAIAGRAAARVLIGGLGMGFTLAAAVALLPDDATVVVAELVPEVVEWNRGALGEHAGHPLRDARVDVQVGDVAALLRGQSNAFDAIVLDVDNGPGGLTQKANDWLYSIAGLGAAHAALRKGGVLAVWSAHEDRAFTTRLHQVGFDVHEHVVRAHANKGARHRVWLARR